MKSGMVLGFVAVLCAACSVTRGPEMSPLIAAARNGDLATIHQLVGDGVSVEVTGGVNGWTPLMHALHKRQNAAVTTLLALGADPNHAANAGDTPLMMAAADGNIESVRALLLAGARVDAENGEDVNALTMAVSGGAMSDIDRPLLGGCNTEIVKMLLEKSPGLKMKGGRKYALFFARAKGCHDILDLVRQ